MKTDYLNNITEEATNYRRRYYHNQYQSKIKPSRMKHFIKLLNYKERAFSGCKGIVYR